ncbi:unnamed protein product [Schistosoma turkestanicum]|nr:unnamed protein product [Schistosoma turkestanicum]
MMVLADTHLVGYALGHPVDRIRRDWQMKRAFQAALYLHDPNAVIILGDILDEGKWATIDDFHSLVERFHDIFHHDKTRTLVKTVVGNHDIGFHYATDDFLNNRFHRDIGNNIYTPPIYLWTFFGIHFVIANSVAFEGDNCDLCFKANVILKSITRYLDCLKMSTPLNAKSCFSHELSMGLSDKYPYIVLDRNDPSSFIYSRPVILQHFPLYRTSDTGCPTKPVDAMPKHLRKTLNRPKLDCLSKEATKQLLESLRPRLILSGHTHYSCKMLHQFGNQSDSAVEWSVASFSWRNLANPGFLMLSISSTNYSMNKCYLPTELRLIQCYITGFLLIFFIFTYKKFNKINMSRKTSSFKDDNQIIIGPVFQPDDLAPSTGIGPALPSDVFKQKLNKDSEQVNNYKASTDFEEIDTIGPLLPGQEIREEWRHLKSGCSVDSNCMNNEKPKRDTWMTELLPKSSDFNSLKPRKFRQDISTHSLHDSSWFTTPNDDSKQQVTNSQTSQLTNDTVKYEQREGYDQKMAKIASECQVIFILRILI